MVRLASPSAPAMAIAGHDEHGESRAEARDGHAACQRAGDAAEIECRDARVRRARIEACLGQERREPAEPEIDGQQAREECAPQRNGVRSERRLEQRLHRRTRDRAFGGVHECRGRRERMAHAPKRAEQFRPAARLPREIPWRLRQDLQEQQRDDDRHDAAEDEERAPADRRQRADAEQSGERGAERDADDRHGDGDRTAADRHELGRECRGIRQRAPEPEAGEKSQCGKGREAIDERGSDGHGSKQRDAREQ